ncbi:SLC13 family permease [Pseudonocardia zijingensis]|uniref:SLC13 family permease n=1 Tax=Pseudonocardia zijingensis TaxID=153376 RepID=A0ABN1PZI2_9PSEU
MTLQIVALVVLAGAFVLGTARPINLGAIALAATFVIGILVAGLSSDDAVSGFPVDLMLILVGVTYLFNVARANGTIDWLIASAIQMIGGRTVLIPWIMFALTALLSAIGAVFSPPIVAPIALAFAARHRIPQPMMGILVVHGAAAGSLSPISVYGVTVAGVLNKSGLPSDPWGLFALAFTASLLPAIAVFVVYGGLRLRRVEQGSGEDGGELPPPSGGTATATATAIVAKPALNVDIVLTSLAIAGMFVGAIMDLDVGLLAITLATLLALHRHEPHAAALRNVPWTLVLLVGGTITYVGVLEQIGAIELLGNSALAIGAPVATVLLLAYVAGIVSAFASSAGTIAALTPLAVPLLENSTLSVLPVVAVIAIAASIVDVSPFSGNGAAVIANATEDARERVYRTQLVYGGGVVLLAPVLLWLAVVLPSTG